MMTAILDVLIEVDPDSRFSLLNLIGVEHIIRDVTGLPAQATMRRSLDARMAERIADDIIEDSDLASFEPARPPASMIVSAE